MSGKKVWAHLFHKQAMPLSNKAKGGFSKGWVFLNVGGLLN